MTLRTIWLVFILILSGGRGLIADGKLVRGENWQRFTYEGKKADYYVAMDGNDQWSGTLAAPNSQKTDGPFATIERAMLAVQELKLKVYEPKIEPVETRFIGSDHPYGKGKDILVYIRDGYYSLQRPLEFSPEDGGERVQTNLPSGAFEYHKLKDYFVTYAAYPGEKPVIQGGPQIGSWKRQDGYWVSKTDLSQVTTLVADGVMQPLARTPNEGYFTPAEHPDSRQAFIYRSGDLENWPDMDNNRIIMLLRWHTGYNSIARIDEEKQLVYLKEPQNGIVVVPPRYYIENVKALLDSPGEWFFDEQTSELSFIPPGGIDNPEELSCIAPALDQLVIIRGNREKPIRNLRFYGLNFQGVTGGGSAIHFEYAHNCELVDSELQAMAGQAVYLGSGCYQNQILSNRITDIEKGAIIVDGQAHPEYWMDIIRQTTISYNRLENTGGNSISAHNCLNTIISHNEVTNNHGRTAIYVGGWRNLEEAIDGGYRVEYNHVHHVQSRADDSGAITTAGMTYDSILRYNLIHHVKAGYFNNNVAIWFDNMSHGWKAENNIYYHLEQDDMKLCACNLVDNRYQGNFHIETPQNEPEDIITGKPAFTFDDLQVSSAVTGSPDHLKTGDYIKVSARVNNHGASGIDEAVLYVDGKIEKRKEFPVIKNNSRVISFETRFTEPGEHRVAISGSPYRKIIIEGEKPLALFDSLKITSPSLPAGDTLQIDVQVQNVQKDHPQVEIPLFINNQMVASKKINLPPGTTKWLRFSQILNPGQYTIGVGNTPPVTVEIYPHVDVNIAEAKLAEYCSGTAKPCNFKVDQKNNEFVLETAGTDFMHGEDSYGTVYFEKPLEGNFVATVKLKRFGKKTHQWFRAGLFVRNDMRKSFDTGEPSLGSVLWFVTPGRVGMNWDRFGNGAMHWASSENHPVVESYPMWLKLVRHGNSFSGYVSYDGKHWTVERHTEVIPGLAGAVHLGLAAGSCDEKPYTAEFENLQVTIEKKGWKSGL